MSTLTVIALTILIVMIIHKHKEILRELTKTRVHDEPDPIIRFIVWVFGNPVYVVFFIVMFIYIAVNT